MYVHACTRIVTCRLMAQSNHAHTHTYITWAHACTGALAHARTHVQVETPVLSHSLPFSLSLSLPCLLPPDSLRRVRACARTCTCTRACMHAYAHACTRTHTPPMDLDAGNLATARLVDHGTHHFADPVISLLTIPGPHRHPLRQAEGGGKQKYFRQRLSHHMYAPTGLALCHHHIPARHLSWARCSLQGMDPAVCSSPTASEHLESSSGMCIDALTH